jgi:phosphoglycolate phosphatase-like HAD superfamily hydrolase
MHLILFDVDGTLIDGKGLGRRALVQTFAEIFEKDPESYPALKEIHFAGSTDSVIFSEMARVFEISDGLLTDRRTEFDSAYRRNLRDTVTRSSGKRPCPGIPDLLGRLSRHPQIGLGLMTGNWEVGARIKLEPFDLNRYFPFGGFGNDGRERRVLARQAVERAQERLGLSLPAERVLVVGDTVHDVEAGRAHGFLTVGVATGWATSDDLRAAGADRVFTDLTPEHGFEAWLDGRWNLAPPLARA